MRVRRRGTTLVELAVALSLLAVVVTMLAVSGSAGARQEEHHESRQDLALAATLLQEALAQDMARSLPLGVLPEAERLRATPGDELVLPLFAEYRGDAAVARGFRRLRYRFDSARRGLRRGAAVLPLPGLASARFEWSETVPTTLHVHLVGRETLVGAAPTMSFRVVAPAGTDAPEGFTLAPHHGGGRDLEAPPGS